MKKQCLTPEREALIRQYDKAIGSYNPETNQIGTFDDEKAAQAYDAFMSDIETETEENKRYLLDCWFWHAHLTD